MTDTEWNHIWSVLAKDNSALQCNRDSVWSRMEQGFDVIAREIFLERNNTPLSLVLDDDKVHCESSEKSSWSTIQRMKHVVCNRWGLTIHTLASSTTGIIYNIRTQRKEDSIQDTMKKMLSSLFKKRDSDVPNLRNIFLSVDRGYSDSQNIISWVVKAFGTCFGTMKRTLWSPFNFFSKVTTVSLNDPKDSAMSVESLLKSKR